MERGLTLLELLIAMAIASIIVFICAPVFTDLIKHSQLRTAALSLLHDIQFARSSAVLTGHRTSIMKKGDSWNSGWIIFHDLNHNGSNDHDEPVLKDRSPIDHVQITANQPVERYVSFIDTGDSRRSGSGRLGAFIAGTLVVCNPSLDASYKIIIARGGRARLASGSREDC